VERSIIYLLEWVINVSAEMYKVEGKNQRMQENLRRKDII